MNFKSNYSYADSKRTDFGDINGDTTDGNKLINEMTTGKGFLPIGQDVNNGFINSSFDGNNNEIANLYINREKYAALFGYSSSSSIKNIKVSGEVISTGSHAAGIVGHLYDSRYADELNAVTIENCENNCKVQGKYQVGGICAVASAGHAYGKPYVCIKNCKNNGKIETIAATNNICAGGIVGYAAETARVIVDGCINNGYIYTENARATGISSWEAYKVINCYNTAEIEAKGPAAGIAYWATNVINCHNIGDIKAKYSSGVVYECRRNECIILNCSNAGDVYYRGWNGATGGICAEFKGKMENCYNIGSITHEATWAHVGGLIGKTGSAKVYNCYNFGTLILKNATYKTVGGLIGGENNSQADISIENCYYLDSIASQGVAGVADNGSIAVSKDYFNSEAILNNNNSDSKGYGLNYYIDNFVENKNEWKKWKIENNEYPIFEIQ